MLSQEENELLCQVGPGTPMGDMLRRFWFPACPSADLPAPDCPPVRLRLLGEDFVAFRDSEGAVGVLDERCCHRGASLTLGRVEDCGIRCLYHGWKFARDGTILETPNLPDSRFKERVKAPAYQVREAGDLLWVYLGPKEKEPEFPEYNWMGVPATQRIITVIVHGCNFVQGIEGVIDSSHVGILHRDEMSAAQDGAFEGTAQGRDRYPTSDDAPKHEVEDTDFGFHYAAIRRADDGAGPSYVRVTPFVMPFMTCTPPGSPVLWWVPVDDHTTAAIAIVWDRESPPDRSAMLRLRGLDDPAVWGPERGSRRLRLPAQDRAAMAERRSWTGLRGLVPQDNAVMVSQGLVTDRSREHLVPADLAIIRMRRVLIDSARRVAAGGDPIGLGPDVARGEVGAAAGVLAAGEAWQSLVPGHRRLARR